MASVSDIPAGRSVQSALALLAASFTDGLVALGRARARSEEIEKFMAMSDDELHARGIARDDIVRHVFRDKIVL